MRELMRRLERLEEQTTALEPVRCIRQIIRAAKDGGALPFNPSRARDAVGDMIERAQGESVEQFEARALVALQGFRLILS